MLLTGGKEAGGQDHFASAHLSKRLRQDCLSHDTGQPNLSIHGVVPDDSDNEGRSGRHPKLMAILNVLLHGFSTESCGALIKFVGIDPK